MSNERAILCGDAPSGNLPFGGDDPLRLRMWGPQSNVQLRVDDIRNHMMRDVPAAFLDLIEIATYVYCADQATTRGGSGVEEFGENWRRRLLLRIPVRNPDLWRESKLLEPLRSTLSFLSEDEYHFEFTDLRNPPTYQQYLFCADDGGPDERPEEVVLFSGGLDSLGGAIQETICDHRRVVLVTHRPTNKLVKRHDKLKELLAHKAAHKPVHLPVSINKKKELGREYTQRSRSFLYASLGATIAQMLGLSRIRFYENGVISLNLPVSAQVVGARATRTTHPQVINGFTAILSAVAGRKFTVENPFLWKTKTEILQHIAKNGCEEMVKFATSCTHTWEMTRLKTHCGICSQCIDRRFAVLAAGLESHDPAEAYKVDLLLHPRDEGEPRTMLASYVETSSELTRMSAMDFYSRYGEASRVLRHLNGSAETTAMQVFELHQRHAKQVTKVVDDAIAKYASAIRERRLPDSCLLRLVCDSSGNASSATPIPAATASNAATPDNYCRKKDECWAIRFGGNEEKIYTPEVGFYHLQMLLDNPGETFSAAELDCAVSRKTKGDIQASVSGSEDPTEDGVTVLGQSDAGPQLDAQAIQSYRLRIQEIDEDLDQSRKNNDLGKIEELEKEKDWITTELTNAHGLGGRVRKLDDERNKVRNRVCNAIQRAIKKIKQYDKPLSEHLQRPILNLGHSIIYAPRSDLSWSTIPASKT